jgi:hypothetical protein
VYSFLLTEGQLKHLRVNNRKRLSRLGKHNAPLQRCGERNHSKWTEKGKKEGGKGLEERKNGGEGNVLTRRRGRKEGVQEER